uniref:Chromosome 3 open reading frame 33 n=1 Tax=Takifugu rubripes TaxID=31033 RepID=A0A674N721_TAKRU
MNNMPEPRRGRDDQQDRRDQGNIVSTISHFVDDNLTFVRTTRFRAASEIPARFIERNVSLRGRVRSVSDRGVEVEHVPVYLPVLSPLLSKVKGVDSSSILVHLAGVELTPEGRVWLQENLAPAQTVWLKLISREDDMLHCLVRRSQGSVWGRCVNEELLWLGLARTTPVVGVRTDSRIYWHLHKRLHRAEVKAERKGRGLWQRDSTWERVSRAILDSSVIRMMRRIFQKTG